VAGSLASPGGHGGGVAMIDLSLGSGQERFVVSVAPLPKPELFGLPGPWRAIIQLRRVLGEGDAGLDQTLVDVFGLTRSQAKLARALSGGISLRQAAAERGISYASARTYLDQIYLKTGAHHQGGLVALMKTLEQSR
jgi:DNA-binding CsgD family transcriptional regulator